MIGSILAGARAARPVRLARSTRIAQVRAAVLGGVLALGLGAPAAAEGAPGLAPRDARPGSSSAFALTVSGGVSLGAFEAGFLYYLDATAAANPRLPRLRIATGASAGSVNALLALRASCADPPADPRQSLFYRVWVPLGLRELFEPDAKSALAAFSQRSLEQVGALVEAELARGLPESCDVVLGVVTSRLSPRTLRAAQGRLQVPVTEQKYALRIQGLGPGKAPRITNYVDPESRDDQALLPELADGTVPFVHLLDAVIASTSFPVAFPPRSVRQCVVRTNGMKAPYCPEDRAEAALFVDGGVFDNSPLRLAAAIAAAGLTGPPGQPPTWRPAPDLEADRGPPAGVEFGFVSADATAFPDQIARAAERKDPSILTLGLEEMGGFVNSARAQELYVLIQEYPETADRLVYPMRHLPAASSPLYAFFGFFDRGFRSYDFDLGMYEARRHLERFSLPRFRRLAGDDLELVWPEDRPAARAAPASWAALGCLRALLDGTGEASTACAGDGLARERVLAQVSLDRLWDRCRPGSGWEPPAKGFEACQPALRGDPPPRVPGVVGAPDWRRPAGEADAAYVTRLLSAYGYRWTDLQAPPGDPDKAMAALRAQLVAVTNHLAENQPTYGDQLAVSGVGLVAADLFYYVPPPRTAWLVFGRSLEIGANVAFAELSWPRASAALQVQNLLTSFGSDAAPVAFTFLAGLDAVPRAIGSPVLQPSFTVRGGYLLSLQDSGGSSECQGTDGSTIGACSRPTVQAGAALAVTRLLRLELMGEWYPPSRGMPGLWAIAPSLGFQLGF